MSKLNEVLDANEFVIVTAGAEWCGYCKRFAPIFEEVAQEHGKMYVFSKVNVQEEAEFPKNHGISGFPTTLFFRNGKEVGREVGALTKENFTASIAKHFVK